MCCGGPAMSRRWSDAGPNVRHWVERREVCEPCAAGDHGAHDEFAVRTRSLRVACCCVLCQPEPPPWEIDPLLFAPIEPAPWPALALVALLVLAIAIWGLGSL